MMPGLRGGGRAASKPLGYCHNLEIECSAAVAHAAKHLVMPGAPDLQEPNRDRCQRK
jgi:hypothetical protein